MAANQILKTRKPITAIPMIDKRIQPIDLKKVFIF
jgi:hypothetical protein